MTSIVSSESPEPAASDSIPSTLPSKIGLAMPRSATLLAARKILRSAAWGNTTRLGWAIACAVMAVTSPWDALNRA